MASGWQRLALGSLLLNAALAVGLSLPSNETDCAVATGPDEPSPRPPSRVERSSAPKAIATAHPSAESVSTRMPAAASTSRREGQRPTEVGPSLSPVDQVDELLKDDVLSKVARENLRDSWAKSRDDITEHLRTDLVDEAKQERELSRLATEWSALVGDTSVEELFTAYAPLRREVIRQAAEAVQREPPDYAEVLRLAQHLYAGEDGIIQTRYGEEALQRFRVAQLESRTVILGILAALAERPWSEATGW